MRERQDQRRKRHWLGRAALVLGLLYGGWLVIVNALLWSGLVGSLSSSEDRTVDYQFAWILWPTVVFVHDFELRLDHAQNQLVVTADRGRIDLALWALFSQRIHVDGVVADGVQLRYRTKLEHNPDTDRRATSLPPMEGLPDPWLSRSSSCTAETAVSDSSWVLEIADIDLEATELWINEYRFTGSLRVEGSSEQRWGMDGSISVEDAVVEFREVGLSVGGHEVAGAIEGTVAAQAAASPPSEILASAHILADLRAHVIELSPITLPRPWSATAGTGELVIDIEAAQGRLATGSTIEYATPNIRLTRDGVTLSSELEVDARVRGESELAPTFRALFKHGELSSAGGLAARFDEVEATLVAADALLHVPSLAAARVQSDRIDIISLANLDPLVPSDAVELLGGSLELAGEASMDGDGVVFAQVRALLADSSFDTKKFGLRATGEVALEGSYRPLGSRLHLREVTYDLRDLVLQSAQGTNDPTWLQGSLKDLVWSEGEGFETLARGALGNFQPLVVHVKDIERWIPRQLNLAGGDFLGFDVALEYQKPKTVVVQIDELRRGPVVVEGLYRKVDDRYRGAFLVTKPLRVGIRVQNGAKRQTKFRVRETWLEESAAWVAEVEETAANAAASSPAN